MRRFAPLLASALIAVFALLAFTPSSAPADVPPPTAWKVVAWNDLGMHCMDSDFSVFSILPPFNVVRAHVVDQDGDLVTSTAGLTMTYEGVADPRGSINTTSIGKTNYWTHAPALFGAPSTPDTGLAGKNMPGPTNTPQPMVFEHSSNQWKAEGIPITPYDDAGRKNPYPLLKIVLRNASGQEIASATPVVPVSDEMDCRACHATNSAPAAAPAAGWVNDPSSDRDYRLNIIRLHDEREATNPVFQAALATAGYSAQGLAATVAAGTSVLCAKCHGSNALPGTGIAGISKMTQAMHAGHATVLDPDTGLTLDSDLNRASCYRCHPGSETRCLRGAMGGSVAADGSLAMQCQSCHGSMSTVGASTRQGWFEEPNCQSCHTGTATQNAGQIRFTNSFTPSGQERLPVTQTWATTPNAPAPGLSLFRFSTGHGGLGCEACHGSTHAEYPALHDNDNVQSEAFQGHSGVIMECTACHDGMPETFTGGPHGMHPLGDEWIDHHHDGAENGGLAGCRGCHGSTDRGTELSETKASRTFNTEFGTKTYYRGKRVGCYDCHNGPTSDNPTTNTPAVAQNATISAVLAPVAVTLVATDVNTSNTLTYRIVDQPKHGTVALAGQLATYYPEPGFAGADTFSFAAFDGKTDSNLGIVTVNRGAHWLNYGKGYPGTGSVVPSLTLAQAPLIGQPNALLIGSSSGAPTFAGVFASYESALIPSGFGGDFLVTVENPYLPLNLPAGGLSIPFGIPAIGGLEGFTIVAQVVQVDPGAAFGYSFSRGIRIVMGN